jgi:hypothetical protein
MTENDSAQIATQPGLPERNLNTRLNEETYQKFKELGKKLGTKTNEETIQRLMRSQERLLAEHDRLVVTTSITFVRPLFECMRQLQSSLAKKGYESSSLSTAVNLAVLDFVYDTINHEFDEEELEWLSGYAANGPRYVTREMIRKFFQTDLELEHEEDDA